MGVPRSANYPDLENHSHYLPRTTQNKQQIFAMDDQKVVVMDECKKGESTAQSYKDGNVEVDWTEDEKRSVLRR